MEFAACTIIAKNYLPMARVLANSWRTFHPDCPLFVLLLDSPQGFFNPATEAFEAISVSQLSIPNLPGFLFKYTILEASTAVKPYLLDYLFRRYSIHKLLYLDPDILILNSLDGLKRSLENANVLLTPHLLSPLPADGRHLDDHDILQAGTYNLGFLGLRNSLESRRLLRWWSKKLYHQCIVSFENNLFVDQRWMDLAPSMFDGVEVLRDPGYNVAYWNLHERAVSSEGGTEVNGQPLYFFHFSGFNPDRPSVISKFQDRYGMEHIGTTRKLYQLYRDLLMDNGWEDSRTWTYGHDFFLNGVRIPPAARRYYWSLGTDLTDLGNPFCWLNNRCQYPPVERFDLTQASFLLPGINLLGYVESEKGVGEAVRSNLRVIQAAGIPCILNNWVDTGSSNIERVTEKLDNDNPCVVNLLTLNADGHQSFGREHPTYLKGHFNIGYWAWELSDFPKEWATAFGYADEVWTLSEFTRTTLTGCSPVPVKVVPCSLDPNDDYHVAADREKFGLSPNVFLFLFLFDFHSFLERKNPLGLIEAYKNAFGARKDVQLLIKSSHSAQHKEELLLLQHAASGANVRILDSVLTRRDKQQLIATADCYVSLHRSEGFGLTMAEAMMYGKPVIATGYSGNVDFMSDADSFLVPYRTVTINRTHGPYKAGYHWADPNLDYASDLMRYVESNRDAAGQVGAKAKAKVRHVLDPAVIGVSVRARLQELGLLAQPLAESSGPGRDQPLISRR
ncbi:MAG: glycosyltransferase family 4 protein [Candidatus Korobacteraceae bacterium]|jgi:glycosyltransferase involved in cell wall biosynthesis